MYKIWIRCSSFDNMQVLIFCTLRFEMRIHVPKTGVCGVFHPYMGSSINVIPKQHFKVTLTGLATFSSGDRDLRC